MSARPRVLVLSGLLAAASLLCAWTLSRPDPLRLVAYGTSLTAREPWPQALGAAWSTCLGRKVEVENAAKDGMDVHWGEENLEERVIRRRPDVVLVEFAINDAAKDHKISKEESAAGARRIVAALKSSLPHVRIVLMSMSPAFGPAGEWRLGLDGYYEAWRDMARAEGVEFADVAAAWRRRSSATGGLSKDLPDDLHPTLKAHLRTTLPAVLSVLSPSCPPPPSFSSP